MLPIRGNGKGPGGFGSQFTNTSHGVRLTDHLTAKIEHICIIDRECSQRDSKQAKHHIDDAISRTSSIHLQQSQPFHKTLGFHDEEKHAQVRRNEYAVELFTG